MPVACDALSSIAVPPLTECACVLCLAFPFRMFISFQEIAKKESTLAKEKRMYMQGWLKKVFVGQAVITTILGGMMASFPNSVFGFNHAPHVCTSLSHDGSSFHFGKDVMGSVNNGSTENSAVVLAWQYDVR